MQDAKILSPEDVKRIVVDHLRRRGEQPTAAYNLANAPGLVVAMSRLRSSLAICVTETIADALREYPNKKGYVSIWLLAGYIGLDHDVIEDVVLRSPNLELSRGLSGMRVDVRVVPAKKAKR